MGIPGRIQNGVVVLEGDQSLPEGVRVLVEVCERSESTGSDRGGEDAPFPFPIVRSKRPGSVKLTNDRIAELLEDEDLSAGR